MSKVNPNNGNETNLDIKSHGACTNLTKFFLIKKVVHY